MSHHSKQLFNLIVTKIHQMISLVKSNVPVYLRQGALFQALDDSSDEFSVPADLMKPDTTVTNTAELVHLLSSLQYWAVDELPVESVLPFVLNEGCQADVCQAYTHHFPMLAFFFKLQQTDRSDSIPESIAYGCVAVVKYLDDMKYPWSRIASEIAAREGHLAMLEFIYARDGKCSDDTASAAANAGHIDCLKFAIDHGCLPYVDEVAEHGNVNSLKYLFSIDELPIDETITNSAAESGNSECIIFLHEMGFPWDSFTSMVAAQHGYLDILKYLHDHDCPFAQGTCLSAAADGHLECLQYLHSVDCPWDEEVSSAAATNNKLDVLKYLYENGCPCDTNTMNSAAMSGHIECVKYLHENGCVFDRETYFSVIHPMYLKYDHFDCLMYFHTQGCPVDKNECIEAATTARHSLSLRKDKADVLVRCDEYLTYLQQL